MRSSTVIIRCCWLQLLVAGGCATPEGAIFPELDRSLVWPGPPQPARIRYVGQLASSSDLKPAHSGLENLRAALSGPEAVASVVSPIGVWMSPAEQLFVADTNGQVVHRFDLRTRQYDAIFEMNDRRLSMPVAVVGDSGGILYVADAEHKAIHRFGPSGRYLSDLPCESLLQPGGLCFDAGQGRLYVSDVASHRVLAVTPEGRLLAVIGKRGTEPGEFNYPTHLAVDNKNRLLVADSLNQRIQRFTPDGQVDLIFGQRGTSPGDFALPKGLAVDSDGHIYVADARFENIQVFDEEGELLLVFGEEGNGPGQFWLPAGLCIDTASRIYIADTYNRRVQVFQYLAAEETRS